MPAARPSFLEFVAGGGMAHVGLSGRFDCAFANDLDPMKCAAYRANFPDVRIEQGDVWNLAPASLPAADLAWASFPCQDLSLAGGRRGLNAPRSSAFWGFWNVIGKLAPRAPKTIVLETVAGLLSSHNGRDFTALITELADAGFRVGAMLIDAALFSPQSRPRLFIVAHKGRIPAGLEGESPDPTFHPPNLRAAVDALPDTTHLAWVWWRLPQPTRRNADLASLLDRNPPEDAWRSDAATAKLIDQMAPLHRQRVDAALANPEWSAGAVFRRIRIENGQRIQRAEIRYDGLAGCLRRRFIETAAARHRKWPRPASRRLSPRGRAPDGPRRHLSPARRRNQRAQGCRRRRVRPGRPLARRTPARAARHRRLGASGGLTYFFCAAFLAVFFAGAFFTTAFAAFFFAAFFAAVSALLTRLTS